LFFDSDHKNTGVKVMMSLLRQVTLFFSCFWHVFNKVALTNLKIGAFPVIRSTSDFQRMSVTKTQKFSVIAGKYFLTSAPLKNRG